MQIATGMSTSRFRAFLSVTHVHITHILGIFNTREFHNRDVEYVGVVKYFENVIILMTKMLCVRYLEEMTFLIIKMLCV